ncbi:hypothetical protein KAR91_65275 [Candidatus Pacearchaeota archaeon]|nr:hypothetical protein [Candidatus Pacearchaeota archaeon]
MDIDELTFDDVLKMGPEEACNLLKSAIARELKHHDYRLRALSTIRVPYYKDSKVKDMITLLEYDNQRRR